MGSLKAPGPDGFPGVFFQKYWDQVKDSVCSMVKDFFEGSANVEKLNKSNIVIGVRAWAVRIAVLMARAWGLQRATIETDCEVLVHLPQAASNHKNWSIQAITDDIVALS
ncbi:hypothetical protein RHMOL_Rhmol05G0043300 [Rhododendron molle]|uniref:Uncharacterized protein n=1 Tax=Rhododendron molle TaxID=49168 RepID=A0ACC0NKJ6_RHOML|nr:hypothetical protein RHMOL_Rhmol05G0043300 [Rhododendron molle]